MNRGFAVAIKKILRILILFTLIFTIYIKYKGKKVLGFESEFYKNFDNLIKENPNVNCDIKDIFNGKITIINIYNINDLHYLYNINLSNKLKTVFGNDINIVDIMVKDTDDFISNEILNIVDNKENDFITKYNINRQVLSLTENDMKQYFNINNPINKIIILNEKGEIEYIKNNNTDYNLLINDIINISKNKKDIYKVNKENKKFNNIEDKELLQSFTNFALIEDFERYDLPVFAIVDDDRILITTLNGEILYLIENNNFCQLENLKYTNKNLYVSDSCNSSIYKIDFDNKKVDTFINDNSLFGISDFDFINDEELLISKRLDYGIGIFNIKTKKFESLNTKLGLDYKIGKVNRINRIRNNFYYFDYDNNVLYLYKDKENSIVADLNIFDDFIIYKIDNFYVNSKNNIYFIDNYNNRILHYHYNKLYEKTFKNNINNPKDLIIYRNINYSLSNNNIQQLNFYDRENKTITPYFSNNTSIFFNINDIKIDFKEYISSEKIINMNNIIKDINIVPYSPSMIVMFEKKGNEIFPIKIYNYDLLINNEEILIDKEYILYGNVYYNEDDKIKLKHIDMMLKYENHIEK